MSDLPTIVANPGCELGENPLWHAEKSCVYWTDIPAGKIYLYDLTLRQCRLIYEGSPVGGFTLQYDQSLLLFRVDDIACLRPNGDVTVIRKFSDDGMKRFNDVIADPAGRVFAGTIGEHPKCGLYRVDVSGNITKLFTGSGCSNGMGFSRDLKTFYWTCSTTRRILRFDYDVGTGNLTNQNVFYQTTPAEGVPDGLTVDAEDCVWSARWEGSSLIRHAPDGKVLETIPLPVANITSACFGGPRLDKLFVTSAQHADKRESAAGALFQMTSGAHGREEFRSHIQVS